MRKRGRQAAIALALIVAAGELAAQPVPAPQEAPPAVASDPSGRDTPRGAVLGFLEAARDGDYALASRFLDTRLRGTAAEDLARQLFVVLDARLPPRLTQISDQPEGSREDPLEPDRERIGTVASASGDAHLYVERRTVGNAGPLWFFSSSTLQAIPALHAEIIANEDRQRVPRFLTSTSLVGLRLLDWLVLLVGLPLFFVATATLNRLLVPVIRPIWRWRGHDPGAVQTVLPVPARLLLLAVAGRWLLSWLPLSLLARQFWSNAAYLIATVSIVWLLILANGKAEALLHRRWIGTRVSAASALLRVLRRFVDGLIVFGGFVVLLWWFGINPTPALAGLGVGGIAVALAAQKTLENMIAGASLVFDQAIRVGDFLRMGAVEGTVEHIGLRSTRIRTLDRTILSVPNGQIANASIETLSARDKYWFHPEIRLRYETTAAQLAAVLGGIRQLLEEHPLIDRASIRARFVRIGTFSLDVEVFAYVFARDWSHFLELQEALLFGVADVVERAGTGLALPSQTMYVTGGERAEAVRPSVTAGAG